MSVIHTRITVIKEYVKILDDFLHISVLNIKAHICI